MMTQSYWMPEEFQEFQEFITDLLTSLLYTSHDFHSAYALNSITIGYLTGAHLQLPYICEDISLL